MKRFLFLLLAIHLVLLLISRFTAWPEMLLWPYLMLKGWLPYKDIAIAHNPLMLVDLTIFNRLFGVGIAQLKIFTWMLIILLDVTLYTVVARLFSKKTALLALVFYIPLQLFYEGNGLWFDLYLTLFGLITFYLVKEKKYLYAGIVWALAFLTKQTAIWFLIPIAIDLTKTSNKNFVPFVKGLVGVFILFVAILFLTGLRSDYWKWAIDFGIFKLPSASGQIQFPAVRTLLISLFPLSAILIWFSTHKSRHLAVWVVAGALGAIPRFEYFHFQPALPFLAIILAELFSEFRSKKLTIKILLSVYLVVLSIVFLKYFIRDWNLEDRFLDNPTLLVAHTIDEQTQDGSYIYVDNAWDNIYALSNTLPATRPWIPYLPWYISLPGVQEEMVTDLINTKPVYIVVGQFANQGLGSYESAPISAYVKDYYFLVNTVNNVEIFKHR